MADFVHIESPSSSKAQALPTYDHQDECTNPQEMETAEHDLSFLKAHPFVRSTVVDKSYGCIVGSALGDTIGLYTEFLPKFACADVYKERKFTLVGEATEWYGDNHRCKSLLASSSHQHLPDP
jgi:hypothetical protein